MMEPRTPTETGQGKRDPGFSLLMGDLGAGKSALLSDLRSADQFASRDVIATVRRVCQRILGPVHPELVDDTVQDVLERLITKAPPLLSNPAAYAYRTAWNTSLNRIRDERARWKSDQGLLWPLENSLEDPGCFIDDAYDRVRERELHEKMLVLVDVYLSHEQKQIWRGILDALPQTEIARRLCLKEPRVSLQVKAIRRILTWLVLGPDDDDPGAGLSGAGGTRGGGAPGGSTPSPAGGAGNSGGAGASSLSGSGAGSEQSWAADGMETDLCSTAEAMVRAIRWALTLPAFIEGGPDAAMADGPMVDTYSPPAAERERASAGWRSLPAFSEPNGAERVRLRSDQGSERFVYAAVTGTNGKTSFASALARTVLGEGHETKCSDEKSTPSGATACTELAPVVKRERPKSRVLKRPTKAELDEVEELLPQLEAMRPKLRSECKDGVRPCPFVSCKYHLYLDVNPATGTIKFNFPGVELLDMEHTCALDPGEHGARTLQEVAELLNMTRERVRLLEASALRRLSDLERKPE